jgi:hypothetical protein
MTIYATATVAGGGIVGSAPAEHNRKRQSPGPPSVVSRRRPPLRLTLTRHQPGRYAPLRFLRMLAIASHSWPRTRVDIVDMERRIFPIAGRR